MCNSIHERDQTRKLFFQTQSKAQALIDYVDVLIMDQDVAIPETFSGPVYECWKSFMGHVVKKSRRFGNKIKAANHIMTGIMISDMPVLREKPVRDWLIAREEWQAHQQWLSSRNK